MGFFDVQTKDIDVGGDNIVTVRKPTFGELLDVQQGIMSSANGAGFNEYAQAQMARELMRTCIHEWRGPDFGEVPATAENFDRLPPEIAMIVLREAGDFIVETEAEGKA